MNMYVCTPVYYSPLFLHKSLAVSSECEGQISMCLETLVTQILCSEGTKRFIQDNFVLGGHSETYQRFTMLRGHWHIIALREHSGISAGILFASPRLLWIGRGLQ